MEEPKTLHEMQEDLLRRLYQETMIAVKHPEEGHPETMQLLRETAGMFAISLPKMGKE